MCHIDAGIPEMSKQCVGALPLMEDLNYSTSNAVM